MRANWSKGIPSRGGMAGTDEMYPKDTKYDPRSSARIARQLQTLERWLRDEESQLADLRQEIQRLNERAGEMQKRFEECHRRPGRH